MAKRIGSFEKASTGQIARETFGRRASERALSCQCGECFYSSATEECGRDRESKCMCFGYIRQINFWWINKIKWVVNECIKVTSCVIYIVSKWIWVWLAQLAGPVLMENGSQRRTDAADDSDDFHSHLRAFKGHTHTHFIHIYGALSGLRSSVYAPAHEPTPRKTQGWLSNYF